jgi:hypothetical protein
VNVIISRSKLYLTPGRSAMFAWRWLYTVTVPGEPYTFDGDTLAWAKRLAKAKAVGRPVILAWTTRTAEAA